jgi:hypothetical protein
MQLAITGGNDFSATRPKYSFKDNPASFFIKLILATNIVSSITINAINTKFTDNPIFKIIRLNLFLRRYIQAHTMKKVFLWSEGLKARRTTAQGNALWFGRYPHQFPKP